MSNPDPILKTYADAADAEVIENYLAATQAEADIYGRGEEVPSIVTSTAEAWMREGMKRGIL